MATAASNGHLARCASAEASCHQASAASWPPTSGWAFTGANGLGVRCSLTVPHGGRPQEQTATQRRCVSRDRAAAPWPGAAGARPARALARYLQSSRSPWPPSRFQGPPGVPSRDQYFGSVPVGGHPGVRAQRVTPLTTRLAHPGYPPGLHANILRALRETPVCPRAPGAALGRLATGGAASDVHPVGVIWSAVADAVPDEPPGVSSRPPRGLIPAL